MGDEAALKLYYSEREMLERSRAGGTVSPADVVDLIERLGRYRVAAMRSGAPAPDREGLARVFVQIGSGFLSPLGDEQALVLADAAIAAGAGTGLTEADLERMTEAAIPTLMEVFGCDHATAWNALYPPNGALGRAIAAMRGGPDGR